MLAERIHLPCGQVINNRILKSAMSENMAKKDHSPGEEFYTTYRRWAQGGTGLSISGNVMVDQNHLGEPNNVVIDSRSSSVTGFKRWAEASQGTNCKIWIQLNHPGRQTPKFICTEPVAPSSIALDPPMDKMFNRPRELSEKEILKIISQFAFAAKFVKDCGFAGVQIHGAHGYLVSQFLSPKSNQRKDKWGGTIENRMRFVLEIYKSMRASVGANFPIGIKLNSADFQKGGFTPEESVLVAQELSNLGIDLIEVSGGSYEKPIMTGQGVSESTQKREAYFLTYAKSIKAKIKCPLALTGGFRTPQFMNEALKNGDIDMVGLARGIALEPEWPNQILKGLEAQSKVKPLSTGFRTLDKIIPLEITWYTHQIHKMGKGKNPDPQMSVYRAIFSSLIEVGLSSFKRVRIKS